MTALDPDLSRKLNDTLTTHLADTGGGIVTGFHLVAEFLDGDGDESWLYAVFPGQTMTRTAGLIHWAQGIAEYEQRSYLDSMDK